MSFEKAPVLVTGAGGFIGSHLVKKIQQLNGRVIAFVKPEENLWRIKDLLTDIKVVKVDITDKVAVARQIKKISPKWIFHLAAIRTVERDLSLIDRLIEVNLRGTMNLLTALSDINFVCFINTGTCEEYGQGPAPFRETQREDPVSPYSAAKVAATFFCQMIHKVFNLPIVTIRPFLTYGPGQVGEMFIPVVIERALKNEIIEITAGEQTREFNYVDDIVDGYIRAAFCPRAIGEIINLGNGIEYKIKDVVRIIVKMTNSASLIKFGALPYRPGEAKHFYSANIKARKLLKWKPHINLREGLKRTIAWYQGYLNAVPLEM